MSLAAGPKTLLAATLAAIQTWPTPASAQETEPANRWSERPVAFELQAGLGGPLGFVGGAADFSVSERWSFGAGLGVNAAGPQGAAFARVRVLSSYRRAMFLETAFSLGNYRGDINYLSFVGSMVGGGGSSVDSGYEYRVRPACFAYLGLGYEARGPHLSFRVSGGLAVLLNPGSATCLTDRTHTALDCSDAEHRFGNVDNGASILGPVNAIPYVSVALGYTLGL